MRLLNFGVEKRERRIGRGFVLLVLAFGCVLAVSGCATTRCRSSVPSYRTTQIHSQAYISILDICEREKWPWTYDSLGQIFTITAPLGEVAVMVGSHTLLAGESMQELGAPVVMKDSVVYVPRLFLDFVYPPKTDKTQDVIHPRLRRVETVMLDAGHGGKDPGAIGQGGLKEKIVVLDVVLKLKAELQRQGLRVVLTRDTDVFVPLADRGQMADEKKVDLFVSIHANANKARWMEGLEVYYLRDDFDDISWAVSRAKRLSPHENLSSDSAFSVRTILWDMILTENKRQAVELAQSISRRASQKANMKVRGIKGAGFMVLKSSSMPAVLVEIGYLSNRDGERKLANPAYRQKMAEGIARGIMDFKSYAEGRSQERCAVGKWD